MCGQFSIPFSTFFGATFIGKALIKAMLQSIAVILLFSEDIVDWLMQGLKEKIPSIHQIVESILNEQVKKLKTDNQPVTQGSIWSMLWNVFIVGMILYFFISILESLANAQLAMQTKQKKNKRQLE
jgi:hypothetical protein